MSWIYIEEGRWIFIVNNHVILDWTVVFSSFAHDVLDVLLGPRRLRLALACRLKRLLLHEATDPNLWRLPLTERAQLGIMSFG